MTRTTPRTFDEYSSDWREDRLSAEMAKIHLMQQMVAAMDDHLDMLERQNEALEAQNEHLRSIALGDNQ